MLWGRPSPDGRRLRDTNLTQFAPDVVSGLYLPLFMFTGEYEINFDPTERLYRARVSALFRNALDPGQYPYPFWHDAKKWADYQAANEVTFWVDPAKVKVVIMQFSAPGQARPAPDQRAPYPAGIRRQVDVDGCQWPEPAPPDALCGLDAQQ